MKLWQGRFEGQQDPLFERLNRSLDIDAVLLEVDIRASQAHARALTKCGVLAEDEFQAIHKGLDEILSEHTPETVRQTPYEDVHTFVEAHLIAKIGDVARKLHTGRSRNDQVATDFRMFVRKAIQLVVTDIDSLIFALDSCAAAHASAVLPAYTHLRRAQPIGWPVHCGAFVEMLKRDRSRFRESLDRVNVLPLGSGAVAGSNFSLDRRAIAAELGFTEVSANTLDATCDRDFVAEFLANAALLLVHASRLAEDWIIYSTDEFGFIELSDRVTSGSSLMPQKKNPDGLELVRAKAAVAIGTQTGFLGVLKGLPTAYNKDLQEDKHALISVFETVRLCLAVLAETVRTATIREDRTAAAASDPFMAATDLADFLVQQGVPFRTAHEIVAGAVRLALQQNRALSEIDLTAISPLFEPISPEFFDTRAVIARKQHNAPKTAAGKTG